MPPIEKRTKIYIIFHSSYFSLAVFSLAGFSFPKILHIYIYIPHAHLSFRVQRGQHEVTAVDSPLAISGPEGRVIREIPMHIPVHRPRHTYLGLTPYRVERAPGSAPRWSFWTTDHGGQSGSKIPREDSTERGGRGRVGVVLPFTAHPAADTTHIQPTGRM